MLLIQKCRAAAVAVHIATAASLGQEVVGRASERSQVACQESRQGSRQGSRLGVVGEVVRKVAREVVRGHIATGTPLGRQQTVPFPAEQSRCIGAGASADDGSLCLEVFACHIQVV